MTRVCMGGTFDVLHRGHRALLDTAFADPAARVDIGLTADAFANAHRERKVRPYAERERALTAFLQQRRYHERAKVRAIDTSFGFALESEFDTIAATPETAHTAARINAERARLGAAPLALVLSPYVLADDGRPIKATRVALGEIDEEGHLKRAPLVAVGSENPVKLEAVRRVFARVWGSCEVRGFAVDTGVAEQPHGAATWTGARTRADAALAQWPEADFGVGVEAGLFPAPEEAARLDVQACVIVDAGGRVTKGQGPGFSYPESLTPALDTGRTVGELLSEISGVDDIGRKMGAVGWLSRGVTDRSELTEPAVLMALLPRLRPDVYGL